MKRRCEEELRVNPKHGVEKWYEDAEAQLPIGRGVKKRCEDAEASPPIGGQTRGVKKWCEEGLWVIS